MKKNVLTMLMVAFVCSLVNAQVGINIPDGDKPQATLQVDRSLDANPTTPDGIILPRLTAAQLAEKDAMYTAAQDGTIVFVTSGSGVPSGKTSQIIGKGFYYYNSVTSKWEPLTPPAATSNVTSIFTGTPPAACTGKCVSTTSWSLTTPDPQEPGFTSGSNGYYATADDDLILNLSGAIDMVIILPTTGVPVGKTIKISNYSTNTQSTIRVVGVRDDGAWLFGTGQSVTATYTGQTLNGTGLEGSLNPWILSSGF